MLEIIEIDIEEFENKIYEEYTKLFPEEEQREFSKIRKTHENGIEKFHKIIKDNTIIGFFMLEKINEEYPYYIDYFAIFEQYQNKGYGTQAVKKLLEEIVKSQGLCIEIETEDENNMQTIKRANFYKNLGFKKVDSEYLLYNVSYTPYVYEIKSNLDKKQIDKIMFEYYKINCGENEVKVNCKVLK